MVMHLSTFLGGRPAWAGSPQEAAAGVLFPRPYLDNDNLNFSFSGLKTAVATFVAARPQLRAAQMPAPGAAIVAGDWPEEVRLACASLNWAIAETLRAKLERALDGLPEPPASLLAAGGVAANVRIRETLAALARQRGLPLFLPEPELCADNATMIAVTGCRLAAAGLFHDLTLDAVPRGRKVPWDYRPLTPAGSGAVDRRPGAQ